jgi:hypothetical protein
MSATLRRASPVPTARFTLTTARVSRQSSPGPHPIYNALFLTHLRAPAGIYYVQAQLNDCVAGATIPIEGPTPSAGSTVDRAAAVARRRTDACAARGLGWKQCGSLCLDTLTSLESCGGCPGDDDAVDCTTLDSGDDVMQCTRGRCVASGASFLTAGGPGMRLLLDDASLSSPAASTWSVNPKATLLRQVRRRFGSRRQQQ